MRSNHEGFTLVELIVVITQIGLASNLTDAINLNNADPAREKITTASWSTQAQVDEALGDLTVRFSSESDIPAAATRITIHPTSDIATVNPTIS